MPPRAFDAGDDEDEAPVVRRPRGQIAAFVNELRERQKDARTAENGVNAGDGARDDRVVCLHSVPSSGRSERRIGTFFAQWGDVGAVRIDGDRALIGFVSAEDAKAAMHGASGHVWHGVTLGLSWAESGAMDVPPTPAFGCRNARESSPMPVRHRGSPSSMCSTDSEEAQDTEALPSLTLRRLESMLHRMTMRRERIARCMKLALDHAQDAETIAGIIVDAMTQPTVPITRRLAILYVMSDILYNASARVPCAWKYRAAFEPHLDRIFAHWSGVLALCDAHYRSALASRLQVLLGAWDAWLVWPPTTLSSLSMYITNQSAADRA